MAALEHQKFQCYFCIFLTFSSYLILLNVDGMISSEMVMRENGSPLYCSLTIQNTLEQVGEHIMTIMNMDILYFGLTPIAVYRLMVFWFIAVQIFIVCSY